MPDTWILTATGKDQPGIVASVTKLLFDLGCNLEDSAMTRLGDEFAIMLMFSAPPGGSNERLERAVSPIARRFGLSVNLRPLSKAEASGAGLRERATHRISVYGADRPGIVYRVSTLLARLRVNITDVSTHRTHPSKHAKAKPLYLMLLEVELPARVAAGHLDRQLRSLAKRLGCEVSLRSVQSEIL